MANKKLIIGLVGEIASGKGTVSDYLKEKYHASYYRFSAMLYDILNRLHLPINRDNLPALSLALRQAFGQDIFAEVIQKEAINDENEIIVVDGIRRQADLKFLKERPEFKLVFVRAEIKIRYERMIKRTEKTDDKKTLDEFVKDHAKETELVITTIGQKADYIIDNSGDLATLYSQIDQMIKQEKMQ